MNILNIAAYRFVALDRLPQLRAAFKARGGAHFRGECFVFDQRVALDAALRETGAADGAA